MTSAIFSSRMTAFDGLGRYPATRGRFYAGNFQAIAKQSLPTDPIGLFTLTLTNVVVGSVIQIEDQGGTTTFYSGTAATSSVVVSLSAYAGGSALNNLRIKVRKGSGAPFYQPWETQAAAAVGSQSIFVSQIPD